jgi:predicted dehydrogenase
MSTKITPFIVGSGRAGSSIREAFGFLKNQMPEITWIEPVLVKRDQPLVPAADGLSIACIANPNALHADRILEAAKNRFHGIVTEKPACVSLEQVARLREVTNKTAVLHVYRQTWGPQEIRKMMDQKFFGEIVSIEGRYWQSSATVKSDAQNWKNNIALIGPSDALLDVAIHWADMTSFFMARAPDQASGRLTYINADAPHRDTHVHLNLRFGDVNCFGSISKTFHGGNNNSEIHVIGSKASASWYAQNPDELTIGEGKDRRIMTRKSTELGGHKPPFHGLGWLEGYIEVIKQLTLDVLGKKSAYPTLKENLDLLSVLLNSDIIQKK